MSITNWVNAGILKRLAIWVTLLLIWETAYRIVGWREWIFPAPSHVLDATMVMLDRPTYFSEKWHAGWPFNSVETTPPLPSSPTPWTQTPLVQAQMVSGARLLGGFALSLMLGGLLGMAMWRWGAMDRLIGPLFLGLQTLPSVCWVPLGILVFGLRETGILFVLVMGSCFAVAISLRDGLRTIPPIYQKAGAMLGASGWRLFRHVMLPASLPAMTSSLRQGFSFAWRSLMGAELMFMAVDRHGLGYLLENGRNFADVKQVVAIMVVMILLAMIVDRLGFAILERRVHTRFGLGMGRE